MSANKRVMVKWCRDFIKSRYPKGDKCEICDASENLDFHHYSTFSLLVERYVREKGLKTDTDEDVCSWRADFCSDHEYELLDDTVTLCNEHHKRLHKIYTKQPPLSTCTKQSQWVEKQRSKFLEPSSNKPKKKSKWASLI